MKRILIYSAVVVVVLSMLWLQFDKINKLTNEQDKYRNNTKTLLEDINRYQTKDSLNVATVGVLELSLSEFKKCRANDAKLIESLQTKNRKLETVTTAQTQTIKQIYGTFRDSLVYLNVLNERLSLSSRGQAVKIDTLQCIDIIDKWFELHGCINYSREFSGIYMNRDSLLISETTKYKRFLSFLWYTNKVKDRKIDVVSKNPSTKILGVEYIEVK